MRKSCKNERAVNMKDQKFSIAILAAALSVMVGAGCTRALRDGVSIGVTDGLSDSVAALVSDLIGSFGRGE